MNESNIEHDPAAPAATGDDTFRSRLPERVSYRSLPVLITGVFISAALVGTMVAMWFAMGSEARAQWGAAQILTILFFLAVVVVGMIGVGLSRVTAGPEGVAVRNAFWTHRYRWDEVEDFTMSSGDPWVYLKFPDTADGGGDSRLVLAVQRAEGDTAEERLETLRAYVRKYKNL